MSEKLSNDGGESGSPWDVLKNYQNQNERASKIIEAEPNETYYLEGDGFTRDPLYESIAAKDAFMGMAGANVTAKIEAGNQDFYILDLKNSPNRSESVDENGHREIKHRLHFPHKDEQGNNQYPSKAYTGDYLLVTDGFFASRGKTGYKELSRTKRDDDPTPDRYSIGRNHGGFDYDPTVSGNHFDITLGGNGALAIENKQPTNPTILEYNENKHKKPASPPRSQQPPIIDQSMPSSAALKPRQQSEWPKQPEKKNGEPPVTEYALRPYEQLLIDDRNSQTREPLYADDSKWEKTKGFSGADVAAAITAGGQKFYVIDLSSADSELTRLYSNGEMVGPPDASISFRAADGAYKGSKYYFGDYLLATDEFFTSEGTNGYIELDRKERNSFVAGRSHGQTEQGLAPMSHLQKQSSLRYDGSVSREHFMVAVTENGGLSVKNLNPSNGTIVEYRP